jgi:hypothetical protein
MEAFPYISKRFALERFLGLTEEEIKKNEQLWEEENKKEVNVDPTGSDLRNIGVSTGDFEADQSTADEVEQGEQEGDDATGLETAGPIANDVAAQQSTMGGGAAAPTGGGF